MASKSYKREQRQLSADERQSHSNGLTNEEQLNVLDKRLGKGEGAKKERLRLSKTNVTLTEESTNE
jgi:hypothetical protein